MYKDENCCVHGSSCVDDLPVAKVPPLAEVVGKANLMLTDVVVTAQDVLVLLDGGKGEPPPPFSPACLRDDAMSVLDKASMLFKLLNQIKSSITG